MSTWMNRDYIWIRGIQMIGWLRKTLKEMKVITYTNKVYFLFPSLNHRNSMVRRGLLGVILPSVIYYELSWNACEDKIWWLLGIVFTLKKVWVVNVTMSQAIQKNVGAIRCQIRIPNPRLWLLPKKNYKSCFNLIFWSTLWTHNTLTKFCTYKCKS